MERSPGSRDGARTACGYRVRTANIMTMSAKLTAMLQVGQNASQLNLALGWHLDVLRRLATER